MRNVIYVLLIAFTFCQCKDKEDVNANLYQGDATAFINGEPWEGKVSFFYNRNDSNIFGLNFKKVESRMEHLNFRTNEIDLDSIQLGKNYEDIFSEFVIKIHDDVILEFYQPIPSANELSFTKNDRSNYLLEGTFNASFALVPERTSNYPDTIHFTDGKFQLKYYKYPF